MRKKRPPGFRPASKQPLNIEPLQELAHARLRAGVELVDADALAAINSYQRCAQDALASLKDDATASVFALADSALAACAAAHDAVLRSILADNAGHPYVAAFADEANENVRLRTRNMLAHSVNRARETAAPVK